MQTGANRLARIGLATAAFSVINLYGTPALAETALAAGAATPVNMWEPALRMVASLVAVLAIVGALAWFAQRLKNGGRLQSGLIQVVSGVSLGHREKVVLLRVNEEEILVGVSPTGMRSLHVMPARPATPNFSDVMDATE